MKILVAFLLSVLAALAQTKIPPGNIKAPISGGSKVLVALPNGKVLFADIGDGLILDTTVNPPVLRAPAMSVVTGETPVQDTAAPLKYTLATIPVAKSLAVWRNGLRQKEGTDYTLAGAVITFIDHYLDDPEAPVLADYRKP